jgi:hypothetical protein
MKAIKFVVNVFAGFVFLMPAIVTSISGDFTAAESSYVTMLLVCVLGFIYCMNTTVLNTTVFSKYEDEE